VANRRRDLRHRDDRRWPGWYFEDLPAERTHRCDRAGRHERHDQDVEASWSSPFVASSGAPTVGTLPFLGVQLPVLYFPHGTPDYWIWDSHAASSQEQRSSSWGAAKKVFIAGYEAYQIASSVDVVLP
jgi:hypothetical protein